MKGYRGYKGGWATTTTTSAMAFRRQLLLLLLGLALDAVGADLVKMCLFYKASGHARTDPILSKECAWDHVHTFYGPQSFHPRTTHADLRESDPKRSTSVYEENQSLYWHPTVYKVSIDDVTGATAYERATVSFAGPYYRWDPDAPAPAVEAFPANFSMIAGMDPTLEGLELFSECLCPTPCARADGLCESDSTIFPADACGEMGLALNFPTCWDGNFGANFDATAHMAYTVDGSVAGACPPGYPRRLPQIQLFVRIAGYEGGPYTFSDNTLEGDEEVFHADFMNGWKEGVLEEILADCEPEPDAEDYGYNPPCGCEDFLTPKATLLDVVGSEDDPDEVFGYTGAERAKVCPPKVFPVDEDTSRGVGGLPRGVCSAPLLDAAVPRTDADQAEEDEDCGLEFVPHDFDEEACGSGSEDEEFGSGSGSEEERSGSESADDEGETTSGSEDDLRSGSSGEHTLLSWASSFWFLAVVLGHVLVLS